jgi:hypothetical protein
MLFLTPPRQPPKAKFYFDPKAASIFSNLLGSADEDSNICLKDSAVTMHTKSISDNEQCALNASCHTADSSTAGSYSSDTRPTSRKISVSFGKVFVRTHNLILGDNPAVSSGLPLALDWDHVDAQCFDVDDYEKTKGRPKKATKIPGEHREALLRERGHTRGSFSRVSQEIENIKAAREEIYQEEKKKKAAMRAHVIMSNVSLRSFRREASRVEREATNPEETSLRPLRGTTFLICFRGLRRVEVGRANEGEGSSRENVEQRDQGTAPRRGLLRRRVSSATLEYVRGKQQAHQEEAASPENLRHEDEQNTPKPEHRGLPFLTGWRKRK